MKKKMRIFLYSKRNTNRCFEIKRNFNNNKTNNKTILIRKVMAKVISYDLLRNNDRLILKINRDD